MKFINGNWLPAEGIMPGYAYSIYDYEMSDDKLVFYLAERPGRERGMAISLPYDTETITSPMEGVIRFGENEIQYRYENISGKPFYVQIGDLVIIPESTEDTISL